MQERDPHTKDFISTPDENYTSPRERLSMLMAHAGCLTLGELCDKINLSAGYRQWVNVLHGFCLPAEITTAILDSFPEVCQSWLLYEYGPMLCRCHRG